MNLLVALALVSVAAPVPKADPVQEAKQAMQGEWKVAAFTRDGNDRIQDEAGSRIAIRGDELALKNSLSGDQHTTFTLVPGTDPKAIDITLTGKERLLKGIYKLEKDKLTICYNLADGERPKEFKSEKDSDIGLLVLERVKK